MKKRAGVFFVVLIAMTMVSGCPVIDELLAVHDIAGWWKDSKGNWIEIEKTGTMNFTAIRSGEESITGEQLGAGIIRLPGAEGRRFVGFGGTSQLQFLDASSQNDGNQLTRIDFGGGFIWSRSPRNPT